MSAAEDLATSEPTTVAPPSKRRRIDSSNTTDMAAQSTEESKEDPKSTKTVIEWKTNNSFDPSQLQNAKFNRYYFEIQKIITDKDEWDTFLTTLTQDLPSSFRINYDSPLADTIRNNLLTDKFGLKKIAEDGLEVCGLLFEAPKTLAWYPDNMGWQCNFPKRFFNRARAHLTEFRQFLIECTETGSMSRQEAVSMIPPLFLDVKPDHMVLDVCAAPGSKTAQILESIHHQSQSPNNVPKGFVVANDADQKRSHILTHQMKRLGSANFIIINKFGQCIPKITVKPSDPNAPKKLLFDRILCDVPCSSDGTLRKSPDLWRKWNPSYGNGLHKTQLSILLRSIHLCKPGGIIVYSTCTFNPIEDEAVVAAALLHINQNYQSKKGVRLELVDTSDQLKELRRNPGMTTWKVWDSEATTVYDTPESVPSHRVKAHPSTMFAPTTRVTNDADLMSKLNLTRCMRFLPHHQDTGGFFVAVLRKNILKSESKSGDDESVEMDIDVEAMEEEKAASKPATVEKKEEKAAIGVKEALDDSKQLLDIENKQQGREQWWNDDTPFYYYTDAGEGITELKALAEFYGINLKGLDIESSDESKPGLHVKQLLSRSLGTPKSIWFVPETVAQIVTNRDNDHLRIAHAGCRTFLRHKSKACDHVCRWRITTDGLPFVTPYLTKQYMKLPPFLFVKLVFEQKLSFEDISQIDNGKYEEYSKLLESQIGGCVVIELRDEDSPFALNQRWKCVSLWKSVARVDLMVKREELSSMKDHLLKIFEPIAKPFYEANRQRIEAEKEATKAKKKEGKQKGGAKYKKRQKALERMKEKRAKKANKDKQNNNNDAPPSTNADTDTTTTTAAAAPTAPQ